MKNFLKIFLITLVFFLPSEKKLLANDIYFIDYSRVMNDSKAGKKAQNYLKNLLESSNKKFNETAKKLKTEENTIIGQKNVLTKED